MASRQAKIARIVAALERRESDRVPIGEFFWTNFIRRAKREHRLPDTFDPYRHWDLDMIVINPNMDPHLTGIQVLEPRGAPARRSRARFRCPRSRTSIACCVPRTWTRSRASSSRSAPTSACSISSSRPSRTGEYKSRTIPYDSMPPGCKWLGVIDGATHMNFAGVGFAVTTEKISTFPTR